MVEVTLSGLHLTTSLSVARGFGGMRSYVENAVADRAYEQIAKVIDGVDPEANPGQPIPPIVLGDKLGKESTS